MQQQPDQTWDKIHQTEKPNMKDMDLLLEMVTVSLECIDLAA